MRNCTVSGAACHTVQACAPGYIRSSPCTANGNNWCRALYLWSRQCPPLGGRAILNPAEWHIPCSLTFPDRQMTSWLLSSLLYTISTADWLSVRTCLHCLIPDIWSLLDKAFHVTLLLDLANHLARSQWFLGLKRTLQCLCPV